MIFRIADCAYRTKVLPGNRATDGEKKAGPRKEGRPCVILCWHVRAASRTCRSGYFGGCICVGQVCPGFGIWRNRLDRFDSGRSVCRAGYPRNKKADCGSVVPQSAFVNPCGYLLYYFTSSKSTSVTLLSPAACDCPPPAPVPLAPAPDWAPAFGPCWAFCWALYISCEAACHALLSSVVALSMSARF